MIKLSVKFALLYMACLSNLSGSQIGNLPEKVYIDDDEFKANTQGDAFHIHLGNNVWLVTNTVHRDSSGLYSYECNIKRHMDGKQFQYEKKWKCPYCYQYWPVGKPCANKECPSKYRFGKETVNANDINFNKTYQY